MSRSLLAVFCMLATLASEMAFAAPLSLGGRLTEANGKPLDGPVNLRFRFFRTNGSAINVTVPDFPATPLSEGVYSVTLSLADDVLHQIFDGSDVWVETTDLGRTKTYPRQRFSHVPYALKVPVDHHTMDFDDDGHLVVKPLTSGSPSSGQVLKSDGAGGFYWASDDNAGGASSVDSTTIVDASIMDADINPASSISLLGDVIDLNSVETGGILPLAKGGLGSNATNVTAGTIFAAPAGAPGAPGFRVLTAADLPPLTSAKISDFSASVAAMFGGTPNQINVSSGAGSITLSTPQNIHAGASPTFLGMTLSGLTDGVAHVSSGTITGGKVNLASSSDVTGTVDAGNGGTGLTSSGAAGNLLVSNGTSWVRQPTTTVIGSAASIGVGTTNPATSLEVYNSTSSAVVQVGGTGDASIYAGMRLRSDEATDKVWQFDHRKDAPNKMYLSYFDGATWTTTLAVQPDGKVGIGTVVPTAKLEVAGTPGTDGIKFPDGSLQTTAFVRSGSTVQRVEVSNGAWTTVTATIPMDDTIPQSNEGDQILTATITPKNATNRLRVVAETQFTLGSVGTGVMSLFRDSDPNALDAAFGSVPSINHHGNLLLRQDLLAGSTAPTTFNVRIGGQTGTTLYLNGTTVGRVLGGAAKATLQIEEYVP